MAKVNEDTFLCFYFTVHCIAFSGNLPLLVYCLPIIVKGATLLSKSSIHRAFMGLFISDLTHKAILND